ncbi:MAG: hypothetical protein U0136_02160 [Bdellovibrionota bacterium]
MTSAPHAASGSPQARIPKKTGRIAKKTRPNQLATLALLFVVVLLSFGCGRKGAPKPPEEGAPDAVQFLTAKADVNSVVINWAAPDVDASGNKLKNLDAFIVKKAVVVGIKAASPTKVARIDAADVVAPSPTGQPATAPAPAGGQGAAGLGAPKRTVKQYGFKDTDVQVGKTYQYSITPINTDGVEGAADRMIRVKFQGESSTIENLGAANDKPKLQ